MTCRRLSLLTSCLALFSAGTSLHAQISGPTTTAQTVSGGNTLTIAPGGSVTVSGSTVAVTLSTGTAAMPTTLSNSGSISQTGTGRGVASGGTGAYLSIQNMAGAMISAGGNDSVAAGTGSTTVNSVSLNNAGTIQATTTGTKGNQAVNFGGAVAASTVTNSGTISAAFADAVRPSVNGIVNNSGTISSTQYNGSKSDGVSVQTNTGVQVTNSRLIEGGRHGISGGGATTNITLSVTNQAGGTIQGDNGSGINIDGNAASEVVTITNNGTITGNGSALATGSSATTSQDGDGVDVDGLVNLTNTGTIRSLNAIGDTSEGVTVGGGTIINSGIIVGNIAAGNTSGATGKGITILGVDNAGPPIVGMYASTVITNSGTITGQSNSGISIGVGGTATGFTSTINNLVGGTIEGGGAAAAIQTGADNDTVNNAGTIRANGTGPAVDLGGGTNTLSVTGGSAVIVGDVSGGTGSTGSGFSIDPGAGNRFSYNGAISNFATVAVKSGVVTFSGASTYAGTTTVSGGRLVVANTTGSATGSGMVSVQNGATLAGNGTIGGSLSLATGATLAPGVDNSTGTLTVVGDVSLSDGAILVFLLGPNAAGSDLLNVGGAFTLASGQVRIDIADAGIVAGMRYTLVTDGTSSGISTGSFMLGNVPAGFAGTFDVTGNTVGLTVTAVPEPSTWAALLLALAIIAWTVRARRVRG